MRRKKDRWGRPGGKKKEGRPSNGKVNQGGGNKYPIEKNGWVPWKRGCQEKTAIWGNYLTNEAERSSKK